MEREKETLETWKHRAEMYQAAMEGYYQKYHACLVELEMLRQRFQKKCEALRSKET